MPSWKVWPTPPPHAHIFQLQVFVRDLVGLPLDGLEDVGSSSAMVQLRWSSGGRRRWALARRAVERSCTAEKPVKSDGSVSWWEGFHRECKLKMIDPHSFKRWIVDLEVYGFGGISSGGSSSSIVLAKTQLDVSKFAFPGRERSIAIPVKCSIGGYSAHAELKVALKFSDPRVKRSTVSTITRALSLRGFSYTSYRQIGSRRAPRMAASDGAGGDIKSSANQSSRSSAADSSLFEEETLLDDGKKPLVDHFRREPEDGKDKKEESITRSLMRLLSRNRGRFVSESARYSRDTALVDRGGDDVDIDPVGQSCAASALSPPRAVLEELGDRVLEGDVGHVDVGSWEERTVASRDGRLELVTEVFLASIDQRSEQASGESACSVLAAVIADWLHRNPGALPLRCQFDELVREGSAEWRRLCADEGRMEKFSDRHFDLDTVLGAKVRPLAVVTGLSYVGFFGMETVPDGFGYLEGAMSFDSVWEELLRDEDDEGRVYIAGWNDHFFVLKVEKEVVYLVDTLGERLFEGCNQAYVLKFDKESKVYRIDQAESSSVPANGGEEDQYCSTSRHPSDDKLEGRKDMDAGRSSPSRRMVCHGVASCKEFIKGFLAALPLRELQAEMERGVVGEAQLHRLLQIEFHYTSPL